MAKQILYKGEIKKKIGYKWKCLHCGSIYQAEEWDDDIHWDNVSTTKSLNDNAIKRRHGESFHYYCNICKTDRIAFTNWDSVFKIVIDDKK